MSVEFVPKNDCPQIGVSNRTWFAILNEALSEILPQVNTNDLISADAKTALMCAQAIENWTPKKGWYRYGYENEGKQMFIDFFRYCGGFHTY